MNKQAVWIAPHLRKMPDGTIVHVDGYWRPGVDERAFYDNTDYADLDLERAEDVQVVRPEES